METNNISYSGSYSATYSPKKGNKKKSFYTSREITPIKKPISTQSKAKSFWDMSFTQKCVFGLGIISVVSAEKIIQKNSESCELTNSDCNGKSLPVIDKTNLPVCDQFSFLEQVGPHHMMPNFPLKESDKIVAGFGFKKREYLEISQKFSKVAEDLHCVHDIYDIIENVLTYMRSKCRIFNYKIYDQTSGIFHVLCYNWQFDHCRTDIINGLENYESALSEIIKFITEGYEIPISIEHMINHIIQRHEVYIMKLFHALYASTKEIYTILDRQLLTIEPSKRKDFDFHNKQVRSMLKETKALHKRCKNRESLLHLADKCPKIDQKTCFIDEYISDSKELLARVKAHREKINYLPLYMPYIDKIRNYAYNCFSILIDISIPISFAIGGVKFLEVSLALLLSLGKKTPNKPNINLIIERMDLQKIDNFSLKIKQCEQAYQRSRSRKSYTDIMPNSWCIPRLETFTSIKLPSHNIKKDTKSFTHEPHNFLNKEQENNVVIENIPEYPWEGVDIPFDSPQIKPIYYNKKIAAYSYFDPELLDDKFTNENIAKMKQIHSDGRMAPHATSATGYKVFQRKKQQIWEIKIDSKNRIYGVNIEAKNNSTGVKTPPLIIFDISLRKKLGG